MSGCASDANGVVSASCDNGSITVNCFNVNYISLVTAGQSGHRTAAMCALYCKYVTTNGIAQVDVQNLQIAISNVSCRPHDIESCTACNTVSNRRTG